MEGKETGTRVKKCGWSDLPCNSVELVTEMSGGYDTIELKNGSFESEDFSSEITSALTIRGESREGVSVTLNGEGGIRVSSGVESGSEVIISQMSVSVESGTFLDSQAEGGVSITDISFTGESSMTGLFYYYYSSFIILLLFSYSSSSFSSSFTSSFLHLF